MNRLIIITTLTFALSLNNSLVSSAEKQDVPAEKKTAPEEKVQLLDINTATEDQLIALPEIGKDHAKKIIANRPYLKKEELKLKGIIPETIYELIKNRITAVITAGK